jgi:high-affinity nickel permease
MTGISVAAALYVGISEMLQLASAAGASAWLGSAGGIAPEAGFVLVTLMLLLWAAGTLPFVRLSDARKATADGRGR